MSHAYLIQDLIHKIYFDEGRMAPEIVWQVDGGKQRTAEVRRPSLQESD